MVPFESHGPALPYNQVGWLLQPQYPRSRSNPNSISSSSLVFRLLVIKIKVTSDNSLMGECGYHQTMHHPGESVVCVDNIDQYHTTYLPPPNNHHLPWTSMDSTPISFILFRLNRLLLLAFYSLYQCTTTDGRQLWLQLWRRSHQRLLVSLFSPHNN